MKKYRKKHNKRKIKISKVKKITTSFICLVRFTCPSPHKGSFVALSFRLFRSWFSSCVRFGNRRWSLCGSKRSSQSEINCQKTKRVLLNLTQKTKVDKVKRDICTDVYTERDNFTSRAYTNNTNDIQIYTTNNKTHSYTQSLRKTYVNVSDLRSLISILKLLHHYT